MEGEIGRGIVRRGVAPSLASARLEVASRTDRGVSAVGNALALTSDHEAPVLLRVLNGIAPEITFTAVRAVAESFRVRAAVRRTYRYFEPGKKRDFKSWALVARRFGGEIDVHSFGRGLPGGVPVRRMVESVTVTAHRHGVVLEIRAPSFVWGMVRKIVAAFREVEAGRLSVDRLEQALKGQVRLTLPLAEPERLVLWEVEYSTPWEFFWTGPNRQQAKWMESTRNDLGAREMVVGVLAEGYETTTRPRGG